MTYPYYNGLPPHQKHSGTSKAAAISVLDLAPSMRKQVYDLILKNGPYGATHDEIEIALGMRHQTVSPRLRELEMGGAIMDSGHVRPQSSGRDAIVWIAIGPYVDQVPSRGRKPDKDRIRQALYEISQLGPPTPAITELCAWIWDRFVVAVRR